MGGITIPTDNEEKGDPDPPMNEETD